MTLYNVGHCQFSVSFRFVSLLFLSFSTMRSVRMHARKIQWGDEWFVGQRLTSYMYSVGPRLARQYVYTYMMYMASPQQLERFVGQSLTNYMYRATRGKTNVYAYIHILCIQLLLTTQMIRRAWRIICIVSGHAWQDNMYIHILCIWLLLNNSNDSSGQAWRIICIGPRVARQYVYIYACIHIMCTESCVIFGSQLYSSAFSRYLRWHEALTRCRPRAPKSKRTEGATPKSFGRHGAAPGKCFSNNSSTRHQLRLCESCANHCRSIYLCSIIDWQWQWRYACC